MDLKPTRQASSPILIQITTIDNQLSKNKYILYCENPIQPNNYQPLDNITELTLTSNILKIKILNLEATDSLPEYKTASIKKNSENVVQIVGNWEYGSVKITGKIINQSDNSGIVYALSIEDVSGFTAFSNFRRKYKTLENVTRKQEFQLDYRLKVVEDTKNSSYWFNMEESDTSKYFFSTQKLTLYLEQIFKIDEWQTIQTIQQEMLDVSSLDMCASTQLTVMNKLKLTFSIELIKNSNFTNSEIASIRILEANAGAKNIVIGTDKQNQMTSVNCLLDNYFDYEYAYLNKNLKSLEETSVYQHLEKLTASFPNYPHFINSRLIQVSNSKELIFKANQSVMKLPFVYILKGFNIIQTEQISIKFYIEFKQEKRMDVQDKQADDRQFRQLSIKDIWNLGTVSQKYERFQIRIMTENSIFCIPFVRQEIDRANFRKQAKQLDIKEQYGEFNSNKYYLLTKSQKKDKIFITKTQSINEFYLLDLGTSVSVYFQIVANKNITHQGLVKRSSVLSANNLQVIMTSTDNTEKVILFADIGLIKQANDSLRIYYKVMQRLEFTDDSPCDSIRYTLQVKRLSDNKKIKSSISPEMQSDGISSLISMQDGFYHPTSPQLQVQVSLRKIFYDQQTQVFDNDQILSKKIIVNSSPEKILQKNCCFLRIQREGFVGIDFDFYDSNIKKRLKLYMEFVLRKNSLFDANSGSYKIKIPSYLWQFNSSIGNSPKISIKSHLSRKKKRGGQINVFPDSPQEYSLPFYNHKDELSVHINEDVGYQKVMDAIKLKCDIVKNTLGWLDESEWYLAIINVGKFAFHFMIKYQFEGMDESDGGSVHSEKTAGKNGSERSYNEKIDPFAKTVRNMDLFNLKKIKNDVVNQGRKLTTKYVKCQETITALTKKIMEISELSKKMEKQQKQALNLSNSNRSRKMGNTKQSTKLTEFYRSICQCGVKNPKYNGYCEECLKKIKTRYEAYLREYKEKSYAYEKVCFDKFNNKQKLIRIKNKIKSYKDKMKAGESLEDNDINEVVKNLEEQELKRAIETSKISIFRLKEQQHTIQISGKKRQQAFEAQIAKEDKQIYESMQQINVLNNQIEDLRERLKSVQ